MSERPNTREAKVLKILCLGTVEPPTKFSGVGRVTLDGMLAKGWIEEAYDDVYDEQGYRMTPAGDAAWASL